MGVPNSMQGVSMKRMWYSLGPYTVYKRGGRSYNSLHSTVQSTEAFLEGAAYIEIVSPGWVDVEVYPQLAPFCITEQEYKLKRLLGEPL